MIAPGGSLYFSSPAPACSPSGPFLEIAGRIIMPFPGAALMTLPLIDKAQPGRFMLYAIYSFGESLYGWLEGKKEEDYDGRWALQSYCLCFPIFPHRFGQLKQKIRNLYALGYIGNTSRAAKLYSCCLLDCTAKGCYGRRRPTCIFVRLADTSAGCPRYPKSASGWPIMSGFYRIAGVPQADDQLKAYMANHDVSAVILGRYAHYTSQPVDSQRGWLLSPTTDRERTETQALLASLRTQPLEIGGIMLYRLAPQTLAPYRHLTALGMQRRAARARFELCSVPQSAILLKVAIPVS